MHFPHSRYLFQPRALSAAALFLSVPLLLNAAPAPAATAKEKTSGSVSATATEKSAAKVPAAAPAAGTKPGTSAKPADTAAKPSGPPAPPAAPAAPEVVVLATRVRQPIDTIGSTITRIDAEEIKRAQRVDLRDVLLYSPGVNTNVSGGRGSNSSVSIRGNRSDHTLILVDGVKVNSGMFNNAGTFLSNSGVNGVSSVEVLRGPQSTLYGSEAIGGVIALNTARGEGTPGGFLYAEGGTFNSYREGFTSQGSAGKLSYNVSYGREDTTNQRPNNDYSSNRYALRVDYDITPELTMGATLRGQFSEYQEPSSIRPEEFGSNDLNAYTQSESNIFTVFANWKVNEIWETKLTLGGYDERYRFHNPPTVPTDPYSSYIADSGNYSAQLQSTIHVAPCNTIVAGAEYFWQTGHDNSFKWSEANNEALYIQDQWEVIENLNLTAGFRYDHYQVVGDALTYRFAGSYLIKDTDTKLRASYGTAFKAPSFLQLYSTSSFALGNQDLRPEESRGVDVGFDQYLCNRKVQFSATFFQNEVSDLIAYVSGPAFTGSYTNRDRARNYGLEISASAELFDNWRTSAAYTLTESFNSTPGGTERVDYVPRHMLRLETSYRAFNCWTFGAGFDYSADREGTDFAPFPSVKVNVEDTFNLRAFTRWDINEHVAVTARAENLTDDQNSVIIGYPTLGRAVYGGVEIKF
ncbi:MAG: TonB-dependent receptor plug domain-containing protein [Candidatus Methylacidiphilales bacterium]|nr:TonB-dependent receptor [Candidatus Methylacidiphilales bacterium]